MITIILFPLLSFLFIPFHFFSYSLTPHFFFTLSFPPLHLPFSHLLFQHLLSLLLFLFFIFIHCCDHDHYKNTTQDERYKYIFIFPSFIPSFLHSSLLATTIITYSFSPNHGTKFRVFKV